MPTPTPTRVPANGPWPVRADARARVAIGVTTKPIASNSFKPWDADDLKSVDRFERAARKHVSVVLWYADWVHVPRPDLRQLRLVARRGSIPEITWEPWNSLSARPSNQRAFRLARIIEGRYDTYIKRWARDLARYGGPVRLRFAHEMNARFYPWATRANGNRPGEYVKAWRRVHAIFARAGARNVIWVWSPVATRLNADEYPGDGVVDVVGLSGFVGGSQLRTQRWRSFERIFGPALAQLNRIAPRKPIELSEVGAAEQGGDKAAWIRDAFAAILRRPRIHSVNWFDVNQASDWRIRTSVAARRAFAAAVASPLFGQRPAGRGR